MRRGVVKVEKGLRIVAIPVLGMSNGAAVVAGLTGDGMPWLGLDPLPVLLLMLMKLEAEAELSLVSLSSIESEIDGA